MSNLLESGELQDHIHRTLQPAYARRYRTMMATIEEHLIPLGVTLPQASRDVVGGYFIWLSLPAPLQADEVAFAAKRDENLVIAPGPVFAVTGDEKAVALVRNVRMCFSWEDEDKLAEGIRRLGQVIWRMQNVKCQAGNESARPNVNSSSLVDQYH